MKTLFSLLLVTIPFLSFGKNAPGYIVTLEYDTVQVEIIVASGLLVESYFEQVRVKDAAGAVKVYIPEDLVAFGYKQKNWPMIYRSKPIENGKKRFLFLDKGGASSSLYYFGRGGQIPRPE